MRNLKKILALVLALVMSFSLMATASAFSDDGDIAADYAEAIDVLSGLEVFKGYDNGATFQPKGSITRAEVAAIIYRIATGDVKDAQTSIYSSWGQFNDVKDGSWYAGYVNYCANAGYIKGYDSKTFGPNDPVTGYQALAMILRAIGYDKNNEFTGSNWQVRTASIAKQRGITDNVTDTLLGQSATRELVAEVLFQSILVKTVTFNTNTLSYSENATSLGYDVLKLERLEGVVVANQFADIADDADEGLATGKTRIETADGDRTLNVVTTLDDIGESRYVYGIKTSNNGYNLVTDKMYDTGDNVIADQGAEIKVKDLAKKAKNADGNEQAITVNDSTEYYENFDPATDKWTSDYLIRYVIANDSLTAAQRDFMTALKADGKAVERPYQEFTYEDENGVEYTATYAAWVRTIKVDEEFQAEDKVLMEKIFNSADRRVGYDDEDIIRWYIMGEVYVGTTSLKDYSDTMSWKGFRAEYINEDLGDFSNTTNGNYLKLVDNNNDGIVEYALKTLYTLDEVVSVTTKDDKDTYYYEELTDDDDVVTPDGGEVKFALNDVIIYAEIDGKCYAEVVTPVSATIKSISFKDDTVTTTDDTVYGQSDIKNATLMDDVITAMDEQVEYNVYLDKFGFIRAYELAQGSQYGLLTEMYPSRVNNGAYVNNGYWIAELMAGEDKAPQEYNVLNSYYNRNDAWQYLQNSNPFIRVDNVNAGNLGNAVPWSGSNGHPGWSTGTTGAGWWGAYGYNYLREATGHLGMGLNSTALQTDQFDYSSVGAPQQFTNTNVAKYTKTEDGVNLYTAAQFDYDQNGRQLFYADLYDGSVAGNDDIFEKYTVDEFAAAFKKTTGKDASQADINALIPVYAEDYIQLNVENIKAGAAHYTIDKDYATNSNNNPDDDPAQYNLINYFSNSNNFVDAVNDTEFFIVSGRSIQHIVGYKNVPAIAANNIRSIYAVAENVNTDRHGRDYWVANVIVIEVNKEFNYDSVVMAWANPSQASYQAVAQANGQKAMSVVDSENAKIDTLIPDYTSWNTMWTNYGFYGVFDSAERDANTLTGGIDRLGENGVRYNDNGVYAGTVQRRAEISGSRAGYIDIYDGNNYKTNVYVGDARIFAVGYTSSTAKYPTLNSVPSYRELTNGDEIIYVENAKGDISFIIDTQYYANDSDSKTYDATWLAAEFDKIVAEQRDTTTGLVTFKYPQTEDAAGNVIANTRYYQGTSFVGADGEDYYLPDARNLTADYDADEWTDGEYVYIPVQLFDIPNVTLNDGSTKIANLVNACERVTFEVDGNYVAVGSPVTYRFVSCYKIPNNYKDVVVTPYYLLKTTQEEVIKKSIKIVDEDNDTPAESAVIANTRINFLPAGTVSDSDMYRTLAVANNEVIVQVDFNLKPGAYDPVVSVQIGSTTYNLKLHNNATGSEFDHTVYFKWNQSDKVVLEIAASGVKKGIYEVSLDTLPAGVTAVTSNYAYNIEKDTVATLTVRTDNTYNVSVDTVASVINGELLPITNTVDTVNGEKVLTWSIKVKNVTGPCKIKLIAEKK